MSVDRKSEVTYIMIKPDGVQRGLVGKIVSRFEEKGYKLLAMKLMRPSREQFERHYADLAGRSFFPGLVAYMVSGPPRACGRWAGPCAPLVAMRAALPHCHAPLPFLSPPPRFCPWCGVSVPERTARCWGVVCPVGCVAVRVRVRVCW